MDYHHSNARIKGKDRNDFRSDDEYSATGGVNTSKLIYGASSIVLIISLCLIGTCLQSRRRRIAARERENEAINRRLNEEARITLRKGRAEKNVLSLKFIKKRHCGEVKEEMDVSARSKLFSTSCNRIRLPTPEVLGTDCAICFLPFEESEQISFSHNFDCNHFFHKKCIVDWLARDDRCPSCRRNYLSGEEDEKVRSIVNATTFHSDADEEDQLIAPSSGNEGGNQPTVRGSEYSNIIHDNNVDPNNNDHMQREDVSLQAPSRTIRVSFPVEAIS